MILVENKTVDFSDIVQNELRMIFRSAANNAWIKSGGLDANDLANGFIAWMLQRGYINRFDPKIGSLVNFLWGFANKYNMRVCRQCRSKCEGMEKYKAKVNKTPVLTDDPIEDFDTAEHARYHMKRVLNACSSKKRRILQALIDCDMDRILVSEHLGITTRAVSEGYLASKRDLKKMFSEDENLLAYSH